MTYVGGLIYHETVCLAIFSLIYSLLKILHHSQRGCGSRLTSNGWEDGNATLVNLVRSELYCIIIRVCRLG